MNLISSGAPQDAMGPPSVPAPLTSVQQEMYDDVPIFDDEDEWGVLFAYGCPCLPLPTSVCLYVLFLFVSISVYLCLSVSVSVCLALPAAVCLD
jgi:hypothetical protein